MSTPAPPGGDWKKLLAVLRQASSLASMGSLFVSGVILSFTTLAVGGPFAMERLTELKTIVIDLGG